MLKKKEYQPEILKSNFIFGKWHYTHLANVHRNENEMKNRAWEPEWLQEQLLAAWCWMLWMYSIHSSQHATHMGKFSRLWSPLTKESPHQIVEGRRGRLTGTGDEKGLLQLLYMGLTKPTSPSGNSIPKMRMHSWNTTFELQSKRRLGIPWETNSSEYKPMSLSFLPVTILKGQLIIPKYLLSFSVAFFFLF